MVAVDNDATSVLFLLGAPSASLCNESTRPECVVVHLSPTCIIICVPTASKSPQAAHALVVLPHPLVGGGLDRVKGTNAGLPETKWDKVEFEKLLI